MVGMYIDVVADNFKMAITDDIYVDKTMLISLLNKVVCKKNRYICISRPRRFGKSLTAAMLCAYYSKAYDSNDLFKNFKIASDPSFKEHLNKYHTIFLDISNEFNKVKKDVGQLITRLTSKIAKELKNLYVDIDFDDDLVLSEYLTQVYIQKQEKFVIIIDEYDAILREKQGDIEAIKEYLEWLKGLLKDKAYVALAYMTGILPIKKYGTQSALNMFKEYSIVKPYDFMTFIGFTDNEVKALCNKYQVDLGQMRFWYNGYTFNDTHIYNPNSVIFAIEERYFDNYWTKTESFESLANYISLNFDGLKDDVIRLVSGQSVECKLDGFTNDMSILKSKHDVFALLVHLGYLSIKESFENTFLVKIPNYEIQKEFDSVIELSENYADIYALAKDTNKLLEAIYAANNEAVAKAIEQNHQKYTSIIKYNDENSLSCVVTMSLFLSVDKYYHPKREQFAGKGFADLIYIPKPKANVPALLIELKYDKDAQSAINQIKERNYLDYFEDYKGKVMLVGINYDTQSKKHECLIEEVVFN